MVGRLTAAVLTGAGLDAAIAPDLQGYIYRAQRIVAGPRNAERRQEIRQQMQSGALMDGLGLAKAMEALYRQYWKQWVGTNWGEKTHTALTLKLLFHHFAPDHGERFVQSGRICRVDWLASAGAAARDRRRCCLWEAACTALLK